MAAALAHEDPEKQLQVRSSVLTGTGQFHGHGVGDEHQKAALERYFRAVDRGLAGIFLDTPAPLVLASVSYYGSIYRSVSKHPRIVEDILAGSPEDLSAIQLHEKAWPMIELQLSARDAAVQDRFAQSHATGRTAEGLADVAAAATEGRVELLLLPRGQHRWARHNQARPTEVHDERQPGDVDLLDEVALQVLRTGGDVVVMDGEEIPHGATTAAILRYSQQASPLRADDDG